MTRRTFALAATAAPLAAESGRIRIGFLGSTHPHGPEKLRQMQESAEFELAGLAEKHAEAAAAAARKGVRVVPRTELLRDPSIAAIAVESDVGDHATDGLDALEAGKHVHLEKSPATDLVSFRKIVELAARRRCVLQPGYMWRYNPGISAALDAARSGALGEIYLVRGCINTVLNAEQRRPVAVFSGGEMFELAGHLIDPIVRLMGKPSKVTPFLQEQGAYHDGMKDNTLAVIEWPHALGIIQSAAFQPGAGQHRTLEILGTKGTAVVRPIEPPSVVIETQDGKRTPAMPAYKRYVDDFRDFAAAIRGDRSLKVSPEEELAVQETLLRASGMPLG